MQTDLRRVTDADARILIRAVNQIVREVEFNIIPRFPTMEEEALSLIEIYEETVIPLACHDVPRAIAAICRTNNYLATSLLTCRLTGCPNDTEHEYYRAVIELVLYARDKVIDSCLNEGIIPGVSTN